MPLQMCDFGYKSLVFSCGFTKCICHCIQRFHASVSCCAVFWISFSVKLAKWCKCLLHLLYLLCWWILRCLMLGIQDISHFCNSPMCDAWITSQFCVLRCVMLGTHDFLHFCIIVRWLMLGIHGCLSLQHYRQMLDIHGCLTSALSSDAWNSWLPLTSVLLSDAWNAQHSPFMSAWYTTVHWKLINSSASLVGIQCNRCDWHKNSKLLDIVLPVCVAAWWLECNPRCQCTPISGGMKPIMCDGILAPDLHYLQLHLAEVHSHFHRNQSFVEFNIQSSVV